MFILQEGFIRKTALRADITRGKGQLLQNIPVLLHHKSVLYIYEEECAIHVSDP